MKRLRDRLSNGRALVESMGELTPDEMLDALADVAEVLTEASEMRRLMVQAVLALPVERRPNLNRIASAMKLSRDAVYKIRAS